MLEGKVPSLCSLGHDSCNWLAIIVFQLIVFQLSPPPPPGKAMLEGEVSLTGTVSERGIVCRCCRKVVSCSLFESHAGCVSSYMYAVALHS